MAVMNVLVVILEYHRSADQLLMVCVEMHSQFPLVMGSLYLCTLMVILEKEKKNQLILIK